MKKLDGRGLASNHGHCVGGKSSPTYRSWTHMKNRCFSTKHHAYHRYGGRGITVCGMWLKFEPFLEDMGVRPKGMSIDRRDNDGNYEPGNCKWSTPAEQASNRVQ